MIGSLHPYELDLVASLVTAAGTIDRRAGALIRLEAEGLVGWGDLCPRPEHPRRAIDDMVVQVERWLSANRLLSPDAALESVEADAELPAPARAAIELACCDLLAQRRSMSLSTWLGRGRAAAAEVRVNGLASTVEGACSAASAGFETVKLKVGVGTVADDIALVAAVRAEIGQEVAIRLDANQAWSSTDASVFVDAVAGFDIEYLEEPLADPASLVELAGRSPVPIAADESVTTVTAAERLVSESNLVVVVKPVELGGWRRWVDLGAGHPGRIVVTSSIESAIGRAGVLHLASCDGLHSRAAGLATGSLLSDDLAAAPDVSDGRMTVPASPGLGVKPT